MSTQNSTNVPSQQKGNRAIIIIGIVIIAALLGIIVLLLQGQGEETEERPRRNTVVNEDNVEEALEELEDRHVPAGRYLATMNSTWYFVNGEAPSYNAYVENVVGNTNDVYFDLMLKDTEEVILESPIIPIGGYMTDITLDKELDAGTYDCVLVYHLVDEDQNTLSTVRMAVTVIVES